MASKQHRPPPEVREEGPATKKTRAGSTTDKRPGGTRRVELNPADCDLGTVF